tara:strand:+ start:479 stop:1270 length:792 start_codon:yes stop_codon:yes gene_type:complete
MNDIKLFFMNYLRRLKEVGLNFRNLMNIQKFFLYKKQMKQWVDGGGKVSKKYVVLYDFNCNSGISKGQYFHQDLLVAGYIFKNNPKRHVDVGSRVDGFVAHVASFRKIEVLDIRPQPESSHKNIQYKKADLMTSQNIEKTDSISCLHAIEHFGMGRYGDKIDVEGHIKGINNLVNLVREGGVLYISFPIGIADQVHFNAHRVFHPHTILSVNSIAQEMVLIRFDYVDDNGDLHQDVSIDDLIDTVRYGCGIYTFKKIFTNLNT